MKLACWCRAVVLYAVIINTFMFVVFVVGPRGASAEELHIAAAADLNFAFKDLISDFEKETGEPRPALWKWESLHSRLPWLLPCNKPGRTVMKRYGFILPGENVTP